MGFLKKFFSIGSKKTKKQGTVHQAHHLEPQQHREEDSEAAVSRLLRSSSARYGAETGLNYASLPPLPHPINGLLPTPAASTATTSSSSKRGTYTVTVHGRTVHSRTEFPNAYPPMDSLATPKRNLNDTARRRAKSAPITPRDQNRLLRLRQDPSVASLLNIYDENGCLDSHVFSNSPLVTEKEGRLQRRRTASTFRQLLGQPSSSDLRNDSDIEWAESVLGETDDVSSTCSSDLKTPRDSRSLSAHFNHADHSVTLSTECDTSVQNQFTFSSLEVEPSTSSEITHHVHVNSPYANQTTPQRASQIFGFLADKRVGPEERPSRLPTRKITPPSHTLSDFASTNAQRLDIPLLRDAQLPELSAELSSQFAFPPSQLVPASQVDTAHEEPEPITINHTGQSSSSEQSSRYPRGPRALTKIPSRSKSPAQRQPQDEVPPVPEINAQGTPSRPALGEKSNADDRYPGFVTPYTTRRQLSSRSKIADLDADSQLPTLARNGSSLYSLANAPPLAKNQSKVKSSSPAHTPPQDKENNVISRLPQPKTPIRPFGFRQSYLQEQPSPASSIELSPMGKQIMTNLRQQRMQARQKERQTGRLGSSHSRIRY